MLRTLAVVMIVGFPLVSGCATVKGRKTTDYGGQWNGPSTGDLKVAIITTYADSPVHTKAVTLDLDGGDLMGDSLAYKHMEQWNKTAGAQMILCDGDRSIFKFPVNNVIKILVVDEDLNVYEVTSDWTPLPEGVMIRKHTGLCPEPDGPIP